MHLWTRCIHESNDFQSHSFHHLARCTAIKSLKALSADTPWTTSLHELRTRLLLRLRIMRQDEDIEANSYMNFKRLSRSKSRQVLPSFTSGQYVIIGRSELKSFAQSTWRQNRASNWCLQTWVHSVWSYKLPNLVPTDSQGLLNII